MGGKILVLVVFFVVLYGLASQLAMIGMKYRNPIRKFILETDPWEGTRSVSFKTNDDKFAYFWLSILWLPLVIFYYVPIALFKMFKFIINAIGWSVAKIFKL